MSSSAEQFSAELHSRLTHFFSEQAQGYDIPPASLYRLEGFIEAGIVLGLCREEQVRQQLITLAKDLGDERLVDKYQHDSRLILHRWMPEAPVYPSTASPSD